MTKCKKKKEMGGKKRQHRDRESQKWQRIHCNGLECFERHYKRWKSREMSKISGEKKRSSHKCVHTELQERTTVWRSRAIEKILWSATSILMCSSATNFFNFIPFVTVPLRTGSVKCRVCKLWLEISSYSQHKKIQIEQAMGGKMHGKWTNRTIRANKPIRNNNNKKTN